MTLDEILTNPKGTLNSGRADIVSVATSLLQMSEASDYIFSIIFRCVIAVIWKLVRSGHNYWLAHIATLRRVATGRTNPIWNGCKRIVPSTLYIEEERLCQKTIVRNTSNFFGRKDYIDSRVDLTHLHCLSLISARARASGQIINLGWRRLSVNRGLTVVPSRFPTCKTRNNPSSRYQTSLLRPLVEHPTARALRRKKRTSRYKRRQTSLSSRKDPYITEYGYQNDSPGRTGYVDRNYDWRNPHHRRIAQEEHDGLNDQIRQRDDPNQFALYFPTFQLFIGMITVHVRACT